MWLILLVLLIVFTVLGRLVDAGGKPGHFIEYTLEPFITAAVCLQIVFVLLSIVSTLVAGRIHKKRFPGSDGSFEDHWFKSIAGFSVNVTKTLALAAIAFWCFDNSLRIYKARAVREPDGVHLPLVRANLLEDVLHPPIATSLLEEHSDRRTFKLQFDGADSVEGHWGFVEGQAVFRTDDGRTVSVAAKDAGKRGNTWGDSIGGPGTREDRNFTPECTLTIPDTLLGVPTSNHVHRKLHVLATMTVLSPHFAGPGKFANGESLHSREFDIVVVPHADIVLRENWIARQHRAYLPVLLLLGAAAVWFTLQSARAGWKGLRGDAKAWRERTGQAAKP